MAKLTATEAAEKWGRRLKQAGPDVKRGIERVKVAPALAAIAQKDKFRANLLKSIDDGTWARALGQVTLQDWQKKAIDVGIGRISAGVDAAAPKMAAIMEKIIANVTAMQAQIANMPSVTFEDNLARMTAAITYMHDHPIK